eukprot:12365002-Alexandrium_andersonii.AAC.1
MVCRWVAPPLVLVGSPAPWQSPVAWAAGRLHPWFLLAPPLLGSLPLLGPLGGSTLGSCWPPAPRQSLVR